MSEQFSQQLNKSKSDNLWTLQKHDLWSLQLTLLGQTLSHSWQITLTRACV